MKQYCRVNYLSQYIKSSWQATFLHPLEFLKMHNIYLLGPSLLLKPTWEEKGVFGFDFQIPRHYWSYVSEEPGLKNHGQLLLSGSLPVSFTFSCFTRFLFQPRSPCLWMVPLTMPIPCYIHYYDHLPQIHWYTNLTEAVSPLWLCWPCHMDN